MMALADVELERANAYLQSTLDDTDHLDDKALQLTVAAIAVFAFLVTFKQRWLWAVPEAFLVVALVFFALVYKPRNWAIGPDLEDFYPPDTPRTPADAPAIKRAMADQLLWAASENKPGLDRKSVYLRIGFAFLTIGLAIAFLLALSGVGRE